MGAQRLTREEKKAETRQALMEAAATVFAQRGLEGASIEEICDQAGFSRGAFYSNFSDKRELFVEVLGRHTDEAFARIAAAFSDGRDLHTRIANGAQAAETVVERERVWCQLYYEGWVLASRDESFRLLYAQRYQAMRAAIAEMLATEPPNVPIGTSIPELAAGVLALFEGYALQRVLDPAALSEGFLVRVLLGLLAPKGDPPSREAPTGAARNETRHE